jgi:hypothetical protein
MPKKTGNSVGERASRNTSVRWMHRSRFHPLASRKSNKSCSFELLYSASKCRCFDIRSPNAPQSDRELSLAMKPWKQDHIHVHISNDTRTHYLRIARWNNSGNNSAIRPKITHVRAIVTTPRTTHNRLPSRWIETCRWYCKYNFERKCTNAWAKQVFILPCFVFERVCFGSWWG